MARVPILAAGLVIVALAGCSNASDLVESSGPTTPATERERSTRGPDKDAAPAPEVGACRMLTVEDVPPPTNDDPEVRCSKRHTAVTYHVGEWPAKLIKSARGVKDRKLEGYVFTECDRAWRRTVGGSQEARVTSIVSWAWYKPTRKQFDDGAYWFRCDLVAGQSTKRLEVLPADVDGLLKGSFDDRYHACWTKPFSDKPNADEGVLTSCARRHRQRAVGIVTVGKRKAPYPGQQTTFDRSNNRCGDVVAQWRGDPRPGEYGLQWPRRSDWRDGERYATCWAVTRK